jgi:Phosphoenolpyruvate phosphomutase
MVATGSNQRAFSELIHHGNKVATRPPCQLILHAGASRHRKRANSRPFLRWARRSRRSLEHGEQGLHAAPDEMAAKVAAAVKARRDLVIIARTDAAAVEGMDNAIARAKLYVEAGADAIFVEALTSKDMFRDVAASLPGVMLLANMTEFGRTPNLTAAEFQDLGYRMVIWPVSSLRVANKAQARLYTTLRRDGSTRAVQSDMQTRAELYDMIGLHAYEELDASIVTTVLPGERSPVGSRTSQR